ncbi:hypothetical protein FALBO_7312 [Fusarium albosuccineum]|uniref:Uncharacterized protein n=1 Tax=Fusarium albosuccineum TaxID=1237068 RepID=A0A8H4PDU8_9HYPO|nr:hypothetical protein FALBO_7312 [Fusarium albosuccineum]
MGNSELNCTQPEGRISANADIVGPGIMSAFFGTATITIIAVVFAYLSGSFDDEFLNELDRMVINGAKGKARRFWNWLRRKTPASAPDTPGSARSLGARKEAIVQFILTLSDQQLITGMAILVSGIAHQRDLSGYLARIADLYFEHGIRSILYTFTSRIIKPDPSTGELSQSRIILERRARDRVRILSDLEQSGGCVERSLRPLVGAVYVYDQSFLSSFPAVAFSFSYGVGQVVLYRWRFNIDLTVDANYMGFGQIMAIFLLVLPFLSAFEAYYGTIVTSAYAFLI